MDVVPIATLTPLLPSLETKSFRGVVTLVWPYSSSTRQFALLVAEQDFRLRRQKGQVRVQFHGASAKAVAKSGVGIADVVTASLEGAQWIQEEGEQVNTPGKSVDWELRYGQRLVLQAWREDEQVANVSVDNPTPSPRSQSPLGYTNGYTSAEASGKDDRSASVTNGARTLIATWASPAFLRSSRASLGALVDSPYDPFTEEDDPLEIRAIKRRKNWHGLGHWKFADEPPSPMKSVLFDDVDMESVDHDEQDEAHETEKGPESPLRNVEPAKKDETKAVFEMATDVHDFAPALSQSEGKALSAHTESPPTTAQGRPLISIQTAPQPTDSMNTNVGARSEPSSKSQTNGSQGSMLPPPLPAAFEMNLSPLSPTNPEHESNKPRTPRLTAVSSPTLPLPSPFPAEQRTEFPFPSSSTAQGLLPSTVKTAPADFARPPTPELKAVSSWNLPLPSPFPTEEQHGVNPFFAPNHSQVPENQQSNLEASEHREEMPSSDQGSQVPVEPEKDYTWKPGEPIQFQTQTRLSNSSSQNEPLSSAEVSAKTDSSVAGPSERNSEETTDNPLPSPMFKPSETEDSSIQLRQASPETLLPGEDGHQARTVEEGDAKEMSEGKDEEKAELPSPTPVLTSSPREFQSQVTGETPGSAIEISSEEDSDVMEDEENDNELQDEDDITSEDSEEYYPSDYQIEPFDPLEEGTESTSDSEEDYPSDFPIEPINSLEEGTESSSDSEQEALTTDEVPNDIEHSSETESEQAKSVLMDLKHTRSGASSTAVHHASDEPGENLQQIDRKTLAAGGEALEPEVILQSQDHSSTAGSPAQPSFHSELVDNTAQDSKTAFPFGLDGTTESDPVSQVKFAAREGSETVQERPLEPDGFEDFQASSPPELSYMFDDLVQNASADEKLLLGDIEMPDAQESKSSEVDEGDSVSLPAPAEITLEPADQDEESTQFYRDNNSPTPVQEQQIEIIDLGSTSDAEEANAQATAQNLIQGQNDSDSHHDGKTHEGSREDTFYDDMSNHNVNELSQSRRSSYQRNDDKTETQSMSLQNLTSRPLTPDASQQQISHLEPIPENETLNQASTKVFPPTPQLTQLSQEPPLAAVSQSSSRGTPEPKRPTRRSARLSTTPEPTIEPSREVSPSPSSRKNQTPTRRSARLRSSITPQPGSETPETHLPLSTSPPSAKRAPAHRADRISSSPSQTMQEIPNGLAATSSALASLDKTPTRRSARVRQRHHLPLGQVPEALSPWFAPRRSGQATVPSSSAPGRLLTGAIVAESGELVVPDSEETASPVTTSPHSDNTSNHHDLAHRRIGKTTATTTSVSKRKTHFRTPFSPETLSLRLGIRTSNAYYTPLTRLARLLNSSASASSQPPASSTHPSIIACATRASTTPQRAKNGPRDWLTRFRVSAPGLWPEEVRVSIFRPYKEALPVVGVGEAVLLREFGVVGDGGKGGGEDESGGKGVGLRSAAGSGWCVWRVEGGKGLGWGREEMSGPPVEFGDKERDAARALRGWWVRLRERGQVDGSGKKNGEDVDAMENAEESGVGKNGVGSEVDEPLMHELRDGLLYSDEA
ncbi:MAG: hypothetical protein M1822_004795 [Bathelium mastoideum]|nr:MAG: hypothetical protein M1822_004795 [Bathelium mastoideum]